MTSGIIVSGLATGLDTASLIQQLMALERVPITRLETKKTTMQTRYDALKDIKLRLFNLQSRAASLVLAGTINAKKATTDTPSTTPAYLSATANADAANASFQVSIYLLATATKVTSSGRIGQAIGASAALEDAGFGISVTSGNFTINGVSIAVDATTDSLNDVIARINSQVSGVTAALCNANGTPNPSGNYVKLSSSSKIYIGAGGDTSNFLSATKLLSATAAPATITGNTVSSDDLNSVEIHIDGVIVTTRETANNNTAAQNAASIAEDINNTEGITVVATAGSDGKITLTSKTAGLGSSIKITRAGTGTGLSVSTTTQSSDIYISANGLGVMQTSAALSAARLATPLSGLVDGAGSFEINGVEIQFKDTESLNTVISRINASSAGVVATYDSAQDKLLLTARNTGVAGIALENVTGNFLAAVGVLSASQSYGQNALYSIDTVNGGGVLSSSSNHIAGALPGVTLDLKAITTDAVTVTVSQDTAATVAAVQAFVEQYNSAIDLIRQKTAYNIDPSKRGVLSTNSSVARVESLLRSMMNAPAVGATGSVLSLADVGLNTGAIGSKVGTTNSLLLDEAKLTEALNDAPEAVAKVFAAFANTAVLESGGSGCIASISGSPTGHHQAGTYTITTTASGSVSAVFTPTGGSAQAAVTGTIAAGSTNSTLISGITLTAAGSLSDGTHTVTVAVQEKGAMVALKDYLQDIVSSDGLFAEGMDNADDQIDDLSDRMARMEERLTEKEERLTAKFAKLESMMSTLMAQSSALEAQITRLNSFSA